MKKTLLTAALLGSAWLFGCGQGSESSESSEGYGGYDSTQPEASSETELLSQDEIDRQAAEQIDASNADEEYQKLLEEMEQDG